MTTAAMLQSTRDRLARGSSSGASATKARVPQMADERSRTLPPITPSSPALEHRRAHQRRAVRAERARHGELLLAFRRSRKEQGGDVHHQDQHEKHAGKAEDHECGTDARHEIGLEANLGYSDSPAFLKSLASIRAADRTHRCFNFAPAACHAARE
jgi:hypothetical protein